MKNILLVQHFRTNDRVHYCPYLVKGKDLVLIAPCNDAKEAKSVGMVCHAMHSGRPPFTLSVTPEWGYANTLRDLKKVLQAAKIFGKCRVQVVAGYIPSAHEITVEKPQ